MFQSSNIVSIILRHCPHTVARYLKLKFAQTVGHVHVLIETFEMSEFKILLYTNIYILVYFRYLLHVWTHRPCTL